tara:strand:- start:2824 stop:3177 length:354 start_codon:yes stop_codon:yes gene_type:complete
MVLYEIFSTIYLDRFEKEYKKILGISSIGTPPDSFLQETTRKVNLEKISEYKIRENKCIHVFRDFEDNSKYLEHEKLTDLINLLLSNGFTVDHTLTETLKNQNLHTNKHILFYINKS